MNLNLIYKILVSLTLVVICQASLAKDYVVEMIFFANLQNESVHISTKTLYPNYQGAIALDETAKSFGFIPLDKEIFELRNTAAALNKSGRYKVIKHIAWLQPGLAKEDALPIIIHAGKNYQNEFVERTYTSGNFNDQNNGKPSHVNELDGTVNIVLGRYLHLYTDLVYRRPFNLSPDPRKNPLGKERILADFAVKSHRKMRSKTLHYIDHPLLGIIVEIRPVS